MSEVEAALQQTLASHPEDWSIRFLVLDKMLERGASDEAVMLLNAAPNPPDSDEQVQRVVEVGGVHMLPLIEEYVSRNPAGAYGHEVFAFLLEQAGDHEKAEQHRSVASALGGASIDLGEQVPFEAEIPPNGPGEEEVIPPPPALFEQEAVVEVEEEPVFVDHDSPPRQRGKKATAVMIAVLVHLFIALLAMLVVILPPKRDEPEIVAAVAPPSPKKQEMQKKNVVKQTKKTSASSAAAAPLAQLMRANAMAKISLPNVTKTSKGPLGIGDADFGSGGFGSGGDGLGSGASFFGGRATGKRFLFVLDHSASMKPNQVELRNNELEKALKGLKGVEYQVLLFAGGGYYASEGWTITKKGRDNIVRKGKDNFVFKQVGGAGDYDFVGADSRLPKGKWLESSAANVKKTMDRVKKDKLFIGTDWGLALDIAHHMDPPPDVIFFMADGTGGNAPAPILRTNAKFGKPPINMVAMQTTKGAAQFAEIAKKTDGTFTIVDKRGKPIDGFDYLKDPDDFKGRL